jgi:hypothetical protein
MSNVTGNILMRVFELEAGVGLAFFAVVIGVLVRALVRDRRSPASALRNEGSNS